MVQVLVPLCSLVPELVPMFGVVVMVQLMNAPSGSSMVTLSIVSVGNTLFELFVGCSYVSIGDWFSGSAREGIIKNVVVNVVANNKLMMTTVILRKILPPVYC
jgi:hypothetical protein